jgi:hypothetical protein
MTDPQLTLFADDSEISDAESAAIVADLLAQYTDVATTTGALRPEPCVCERPLVFAAELGEGRCGLCGREPRNRGSDSAPHDFEVDRWAR